MALRASSIGAISVTLLAVFLARAQETKPPKIAANAQAASVLILVNDEVPPAKGTGRTGASVWVGRSYAAKRGIPEKNIVHLQIPNTGGVTDWDAWHIRWEVYDEYIRRPVLKALASHAASGPIDYIVPVWGVPSHLATLPGASGESWSIDSFLAAIQSGNTSLWLANPYQARVDEQKAHFRDWKNPAGWKMYLVARLDGPSPQIAVGLVDKAMHAETNLKTSDGVGYFDYRHAGCCDGTYYGDETVRRAYELSQARGFRSVLNDQTKSGHMIQAAPETLWAWGWYSGASTNDVYQFVEGAIGAQLTSYTAEGIRVPRGGAWVELWLRRGITATWGATTEPTVEGYAKADTFFSHFWTGYNFAESGYLASPVLNHTMVFVGDPLYAPAVFRAKSDQP